MSPARERGFTLVELMVSVAVTLFIVAAVCTVLLAATRITHQQELTADAADAAIYAEGVLVRSVSMAGLGTAQGFMVYQGGTQTINPVHTIDNSSNAGVLPGTDELYLVAPYPNSPFETCSSDASGNRIVSVNGTPATPMNLACAGTQLATGDNVVAFDMSLRKGCLLTNITVTGNQITAFQESSKTTFAPDGLSLKAGLLVYRAQLLHYYIAMNPASGLPALWMEKVQLGSSAGGEPFAPLSTPSTSVVQDGIEDLQVAFELDTVGAQDPSQYTLQYGLGPAWNGNVRALQLSLVALTRQPLRQDNQQVMTDGTAMTVQNHVLTAPVPDGRRRTVVHRRIELLNLGSASI